MLTDFDSDRSSSYSSRGSAVAEGGLAEVISLPKNEAGGVLTSTNIAIATAVTLLPIPLGLIGGLGGIGLAIYFSSFNQALAGVCAVTGMLWGFVCVQVLLRYQQFLPSRYMQAAARRAFAHRASPLVRFDQPGVEFLDIIPRSNWGRTMAEPATDIGLLFIDQARQTILFEGDNKRYRIPFASVNSCQVEEIRMDSDQWGTDLYYVTVLSVETANGSREIPFSGRQLTPAKRRMPQRRQQAEALCEMIQQALAG